MADNHRAAPQNCPPDENFHFVCLCNFAAILYETFDQQGVPSDLDGAITLYRAALDLLPPNHSDRFMPLYNLAISLNRRFEQRSVPSDLDKAIELHRDALLFCPPGHSKRYKPLNNIANSLRDRFRQRGVLSDLDEAIDSDRAALLLRPLGHIDRFTSLNNLALCLGTRFRQQGVPSDLDEAIELNKSALSLCPPGHPDRSMSLDNLAQSLSERFRQHGIPSDLDKSIEFHQAALLLLPDGHSRQSSSLNNLALGLQDRFKQQGVPSDLDEAIKHNRAALLLRPHGHSDRPMSLNNLASSLQVRFKQRGVLSDLDEAIELHEAALHLRPHGHSDRSMSLCNLASSLLERLGQRGVPSDLDEAFRHTDLGAAKLWATSADIFNHDSALLAYKTALKFLDQRVALLSSSSCHFDVIREAVSSLATDAFSCSVRHGALTTAVELGETGVALAEEFKRLSFRLRNAFDQSTENQSPEIRQLTTQWDDVVSRIRKLSDFSRFLLPPLFSDLQKAAEAGPVVIVNASWYSCDALIILSGQDPVHVPLDIAPIEACRHPPQALEYIVHPIVKALEESEVRPGSRIWWCPTAEFTLLPLHAAGPYEKHRDNLSDIYISSYTPTLATLIRARQRVSQDVSLQHFVAIGQGNPDSGKKLSCIAPELEDVAQRLVPIVSFTSLEDSDATVQGALDALNHNQWLHLACHGTPNRTQPFESSFAMRDGPLMIKDIIRSDWQNPEFAFLSACHTAVGDEKSPDELIHLAAAMQFSGFRSVIGSMWSVDDEVARQVVSTFYRHLVDGLGRLDCTRAAVALHKTMKSLRKKIPLEQQIVFVHTGV
ncbi:CHAT domain-containing protein [Suillus occidentalis]|nr:CHAT domain-containing protein [Suillus occidentalis]